MNIFFFSLSLQWSLFVIWMVTWLVHTESMLARLCRLWKGERLPGWRWVFCIFSLIWCSTGKSLMIISSGKFKTRPLFSTCVDCEILFQEKLNLCNKIVCLNLFFFFLFFSMCAFLEYSVNCPKLTVTALLTFFWIRLVHAMHSIYKHSYLGNFCYRI